MEETNPEVLELIDDVKKLFKDVDVGEIIAILATSIFESYEENYQEWSKMYLVDK